ncbi:hypothetical protein SDC9_78703 [bioreactor metagenome]|uniref:DUF3298 domain-containing protein n=1 Tax=bioreactor metagenome TaxID=1076179 RepID=A0A644Z1T7_9ZZZZ
MSSRKKNKKKELKRQVEMINEKLYPALENTAKGRLYGYMNSRGDFLIQPIYTNAYDFNNKGLAVVQYGEKFGIINKRGEYVVKPIYDNINDFKENRAIFSLNNNMGVFNEKGNIINNKDYDYISDYNEKRAIIGSQTVDEGYRYGYLYFDGTEEIQPIYLDVGKFKNSIALIKVRNGEYRLINLYEQVINTYNYNYVSQYGEGLMVFGNSQDGPLGYIDIGGQVVIPPKFKQAEAFKDGVAVVSEADSFGGPYGVINKKGEYIYQPIFNDIKNIGEDRLALGMGIGEGDIKLRNIYAIGDTSGKVLTDFIYRYVGEYKDGLAYASDETSTFFIDNSGNKVTDFPSVSGSGELSVKNGLIYANIDNSPYYLDKSGNVVHKPSDIIKLDDKYSILIQKYKPNINYLIYYPKVQGLDDENVEAEINNRLRRFSYFIPEDEKGNQKNTPITEDDILDYDYYGDFSIKYFEKNLLGLEIEGYYYPVKAAHGMPIKKTPIIDLKTGKFYTLSDLFMGGVNWVGELNNIIKDRIDNDKQYDYVFKEQFKGINPDQGFYIDDNNLYIYFQPYEIGPYSAGFITFKIPFSEIQGMINKNGDFYKALRS